jgi:hypothetical protein
MTYCVPSGPSPTQVHSFSASSALFLRDLCDSRFLAIRAHPGNPRPIFICEFIPAQSVPGRVTSRNLIYACPSIQVPSLTRLQSPTPFPPQFQCPCKSKRSNPRPHLSVLPHPLSFVPQSPVLPRLSPSEFPPARPPPPRNPPRSPPAPLHLSNTAPHRVSRSSHRCTSPFSPESSIPPRAAVPPPVAGCMRSRSSSAPAAAPSTTPLLRTMAQHLQCPRSLPAPHFGSRSRHPLAEAIRG